MTEDECALAMTAFRQAWQYTPMSDVQARQFQRLFRGHMTSTVRDVIDDLIRIGATRPGPAEMGEILRSKSGRVAAGQRVHRDGPYLDDPDLSKNLTPTDAVGIVMDAVRDHKHPDEIDELAKEVAEQ